MLHHELFFFSFWCNSAHPDKITDVPGQITVLSASIVKISNHLWYAQAFGETGGVKENIRGHLLITYLTVTLPVHGRITGKAGKTI